MNAIERFSTSFFVVSLDDVQGWEVPPVQRQIVNNKKLLEVTQEIAETGEIPGTIDLGFFENRIYIVNGQHRIKGFQRSGLETVRVHLRTQVFESMADLATAFVKANTPIARITPDDILRALEPNTPTLALIRERCPFVTYERVRRNGTSPNISMSVTLACWRMSRNETPVSSKQSAAALASQLSMDEAEELTRYLKIVHEAWGLEPEYRRLWGRLNSTICAWIYRRMVVMDVKKKHYTKFSPEDFRKAMQAVSSSSRYLDWLPNREISERHRSPCYARIRKIVNSMSREGARIRFPHAPWAGSGSTIGGYDE